jgi:hypothetical protein
MVSFLAMAKIFFINRNPRTLTGASVSCERSRHRPGGSAPGNAISFEISPPDGNAKASSNLEENEKDAT